MQCGTGGHQLLGRDEILRQRHPEPLHGESLRTVTAAAVHAGHGNPARQGVTEPAAFEPDLPQLEGRQVKISHPVPHSSEDTPRADLKRSGALRCDESPANYPLTRAGLPALAVVPLEGRMSVPAGLAAAVAVVVCVPVVRDLAVRGAIHQRISVRVCRPSQPDRRSRSPRASRAAPCPRTWAGYRARGRPGTRRRPDPPSSCCGSSRRPSGDGPSRPGAARGRNRVR